MQMHSITHNNILPNPKDSIEDEEEHLYGSGWTRLLEKKLAHYYEKEYALAFSSATQALFFICIALEIKKKEIIASPFNWGGCLAPFLFFNNKFLFNDFDFDNYCISPSFNKKILTANCTAILSVDYCGNPAATKELKKFCAENNLLLISDSSQSFGAYKDDKPAGYYADIIIVSFGPGKSIYGGEGGAVITSDTNLYERLVWISQHPNRQKKMFGFNYFNQFSLNGRINPFAAKNIIINWDKSIKSLNSRQRYNFDIYQELLNKRVIKKKRFLQASNNSTFYTSLYELNNYCDITETEIKLSSRRFKLSLHQIQLINNDKYFRNNFKKLSKTYLSKNFIHSISKKQFAIIESPK